MGYKFKSFILARTSIDHLDKKQSEELDRLFDEGWEYVDSICQHIAGSNIKQYGPVIVILKKEK